ncbi:hypothetical protein UZ36_02615 [Candidatus Nitromaritima sp. SCGC AAA799-C22]|nr:hypothetical protein UZ36_02615 [Candidatus Nitromaritima sp. SCGC AAA799-C22]
MKNQGITFILSAPSGTGKTTTCRLLKERLPELKFSVSHTTRPPRDGEKEGVDYFFIQTKEFEKKIERGEFLEWAKVHKQYYGTAFETIDRYRQNGQDLLLEIDVQGAQTLRDLNYEGVFIFILPPSVKELETRLTKRGTEPEEKIRERVEEGKREIQKLDLYDYILTNSRVEETADNLLSIIRAERCRREQYLPPSTDLQILLDSRVKA